MRRERGRAEGIEKEVREGGERQRHDGPVVSRTIMEKINEDKCLCRNEHEGSSPQGAVLFMYGSEVA